MWVDQYPVTSTCPTCGVFYATYGTAPNRTFVVEWRDAYFPGNPTPNLNYEVIFNEATALTGRFDVYYNLVTSHAGGTDSALTVGVQQNGTNLTQVGCDASGTIHQLVWRRGHYFIWTLGTCATPTPTATPICPPMWTPMASIPTGVNAPQLRYGFAQTATDFYLVGGLNSGFATTGALVRYNIADQYLDPAGDCAHRNRPGYFHGRLERQDSFYRRYQRHAHDDRPDL